MKQIELATTGKQTSQLGFGCSSVMSATGKAESLRLLEYAFEIGIRHFDVAPMYGYGAAEKCLGEFLARHPGQFTVTTKYGIPAPSKQGMIQTARSVARPLLQVMPGLKRKLAGAAQAVTSNPLKASFTAAEAEQALDHSLAQLCLERTDLWLLHEAEASDLNDDGLFQFLQNSLAAGKIGAFGVGSSADKLPALLANKPDYCPVLQFEWSILDKHLETRNVFTLHHRTLTANFATLRSALEREQSTRDRWSRTVGADLAHPGTLAALMLKAALIMNPESVILVSSTNPAHIRDNVAVAEDNNLTQPARELYRLAQQEAASVLALAKPTYSRLNTSGPIR